MFYVCIMALLSCCPQEKSSVAAIRCCVSAFKAAVQETAVEATEHGKYRVEGSRGEGCNSYGDS